MQRAAVERVLVGITRVLAVRPDVQDQLTEQKHQRSDAEEEEERRDEEQFVRWIVAQRDKGLALNPATRPSGRCGVCLLLLLSEIGFGYSCTEEFSGQLRRSSGGGAAGQVAVIEHFARLLVEPLHRCCSCGLVPFPSLRVCGL